jgi:hypothetical protein
MINAWLFLWLLFFAVGILISYWRLVGKACHNDGDVGFYGVGLPAIIFVSTMLFTSGLMHFARAVG